MLYTNVLCRNHLAVEHHVLGTILLVVLLNKSEDSLYEMQIIIVWSNLQSHELCCLYQSVDTDGKILTADVDISCVEEWQHTTLLELLKVLVVCELYLMAEVDNTTKILQVVELVVYCILDTTIQVNSEHTLRTC